MSKRIEKRLRIRRKPDVKEGWAKINTKTRDLLNLSGELEVVVGGKKRFRFKILALDDIPPNEVWCNEEELRRYGIADNTIATCRAPLYG
ncbi:MAG: hypothetical protein DRJ32_00875 [Thermoprotei archaeon]|nr:MAG: hypothetical protein DRJ32_00875 [Thermoprotei archaeon]